jgi:GDPmannose 4,6-dehydratase
LFACSGLLFYEKLCADSFCLCRFGWEHLVTDASLYRPTKIAIKKDNLGKTEQYLGAEANYKMQDVRRLMVEEKIGNV